MENPQVAIVIVNYNTGPLLARCLSRIHEFVTLPYEVIVVDNQSRDTSLENLPALPQLTVWRESTNWGFAKACNLGAKRARAPLLHFLNPDTEVGPDITTAYREAGNGLYATKIVDEQDREVASGFTFPTFANLWRLTISRGKRDCWYVGASVIVRADVFRKLGEFSEEYILYAEDTDLFYKAHLAGIPIQQLPTRVRHYQGGSSKQIWSARQRLLRVECAGWMFARKFHLRLSYLLYRHLGFVKGVWREPVHTVLEFITLWQILLFGFDNRLPGGPPA